MHVPGAQMAERIGGKFVLGWAMVFTTFFTLITPVCVHWGGSTALIAIRMTVGTLQGGLWPAVSTFLMAWVPKSEKGTLSGLALAGVTVSSIHIKF